jgi:hypothetical protein
MFSALFPTTDIRRHVPRQAAWRVLVDLVRLIQASAPVGAKTLPREIVPAIEETVRSVPEGIAVLF